jgi:hypothetical protein
MRFDPEQVVVARTVGALNSQITHEMGHVLGIGTLGSCPSNMTCLNPLCLSAITCCRIVHRWAIQATELYSTFTTKANLEYQQLSQCTTNVPAADPSCNYLAESCLQTELMSPGINANAPMSRIPIGWLEDLGYQVNYFAAEPFD